MKIIQFTPYLAPHKGGLEKVAETISSYLAEGKYCEVINITSSLLQKEHLVSFPKIIYKNKHIGYFIHTYEVISVPSFEIVHNFPCPKIWKLDFRIIMQYIQSKHPDIIQTHTRFFLQTMLGGIIAKRLKKPRVHIEHGSGYVTGYPFYIRFFANLFDNTIGRRIFRQANNIVTISKNNIPFIQKFTKKEITVIYNPIDYLPKEKIENKIPHIGFVGRLVPLKGVDILIQALKSSENKEWKCTIVGEGSQRSFLKKLSQDQGLSDRITFVGSDDRANWMHRFTILVNPSYQEGLPTTVVEGLLSKCVVVATDVGGTSEISDQKDLILVKSGEVKDLQKGLEYALQNNEKICGLSYDLVKEKFDGKRSVNKYFEVYTGIMGHGK